MDKLLEKIAKTIYCGYFKKDEECWKNAPADAKAFYYREARALIDALGLTETNIDLAIRRGYCTPENCHKPMDSALIQAQVRILLEEMSK